jgi:hypothetical protein
MPIDPRPVLYLDLDDTLLSWQSGSPRAARGAREFVLWALERFEVRWLTRWCPSGEMSDSHLEDLGNLLNLPPKSIRHIRGFEWGLDGSKLDGIAWLEHLVLERPFLWVEDEKGVGERELRFLEDQGLLDSYHPVNVTEDPGSLQRLHAVLRLRWMKEPPG